MTKEAKMLAVVEAMRRAIAEWDSDGEMDVSPMRAVTERGGLVVAKVPGKHPYPEYDQFDDLIHGYKSALAAVRASAVEVE